MLGKLTWDAIPFNEPIPMAAGAVVVLVILGLLIWITANLNDNAMLIGQLTNMQMRR